MDLRELEKSIFEAQGKQGLRTTPLIQFLEKKIAGEASDFTGKPLSKNFLKTYETRCFIFYN